MSPRSTYGPFILLGGALAMMIVGGVFVFPDRLNGVKEVRLSSEDPTARNAAGASMQGEVAGATTLSESRQVAGSVGGVGGVDPRESVAQGGNDAMADPPQRGESLAGCIEVLNGTEYVGMARYCECYAAQGKLDAEFRAVSARVGPVKFTMHVYRRSDIVSNEIASRMAWELGTSNMFLSAMHQEYEQLVKGNATIQKSDLTFLDIGANIGWYSVLMAAHGYRVIAIEPMTKNLQALRASVCANNLQHLMETHHTALAEQKQECAIVSHGANTGDGIVVCGDSWKKEGYVTRELVHINRLDDIVPENEPIKVAKIDVEGYEAHVLGGGRRTLLLSGISKIMSEFGPEMMGNAQSDPLQYLRAWGEGGYVIRKTRFDTGEIVPPSKFEATIELWKKAIVNIFVQKQEGQTS